MKCFMKQTSPQFTIFSSSGPLWYILCYSWTVCGGYVLTKCFAEGPLVTSCTCYDCVLTFDLLSKYWIRSSIHSGLIGVSHKALSHLNPQLWGGGCIPPVCVCMCDCMQAFICVCVLCCGVNVLPDDTECSSCGSVMSLYMLST